MKIFLSFSLVSWCLLITDSVAFARPFLPSLTTPSGATATSKLSANIQQRELLQQQHFQPAAASVAFRRMTTVSRGGAVVTADATATTTASWVGVIASGAASLGTSYAMALEQSPILTKSVTASIIFGLSDYLAQILERSSSKSSTKTVAPPATTSTSTPNVSLNRITWSMAVGLFYFGPAAHFWYDAIFRLLPSTTLWSTLQKAALGQLIFGPSFTCIFFAVALIQQSNQQHHPFTLRAWFTKIRQDLPSAWLAGVGFWPLVDLVSYSAIPRQWIPLFINMCSLVWTIYLSLIANKKNTTNKS